MTITAEATTTPTNTAATSHGTRPHPETYTADCGHHVTDGDTVIVQRGSLLLAECPACADQ